ncbi:MAG: GAF domain-containing protein [Actinomycetota bacterium]|nr:GAF domain-containing protein [Actinomycetota bacterium]
MADADLRAAVAAGVLGVEEAHRDLLRSIADTARAIFSARASSIFLLDEERDELVFEAVSGEGSKSLLGRRMPSDTGIAGWVLIARQPLVLDDVGGDPRFAKDVAEATGYVPSGMMAVPLLHGDEALGVLQVLDRKSSRFSLAEMELLGLFANQAAIALHLLGRARRARKAADGDASLAPIARLAARLETLPPERQQAGLALLEALERVLAT